MLGDLKQLPSNTLQHNGHCVLTPEGLKNYFLNNDVTFIHKFFLYFYGGFPSGICSKRIILGKGNSYFYEVKYIKSGANF